MNSRPLIGLITNDLVGTYQYSFWTGMKAAAAEEDCDLVSFNGGELGSSDRTKAMRNSAFDLIPGFQPDALVVLSPPLSNSADPRSNEAFFDSIRSIPHVTVGFRREGCPSVLVDNAAGMAAAVEHLILVHGRSRFAFVGGPNFNPDAMERREAFLSTLERNGIAFDPRLEASAGWDFGIARERVLALVDSGIPFDAIVTANDDMALAAMDALRERGRIVPDEVVVSGFDDIEEGQWSSPSLSTVHQPVVEQGRESVRMALDMLDGAHGRESVLLRSGFTARGSCGCGSASIAEARGDLSKDPPPAVGRWSSADLRSAVEARCAETLGGGSRFSDALGELVEAIRLGCELREDASALAKMSRLMDLASSSGDKPDRWQAFLTVLRRASRPFFAEDPALCSRLEALLHELRMLAQERSVQALSQKSAQVQRWSREVYQTALRLTESDGLDDFGNALAASARILRISSLQLLVRVHGKGWRIPLSVDKGVRTEMDSGFEEIAPLVRRIRDNAHFRTAKVVEPLVFGDRHLGHLIVEPSVRLGMLLDSFRGQIASVLVHLRRHRTHEQATQS